jgi:hypothetical protein
MLWLIRNMGAQWGCYGSLGIWWLSGDVMAICSDVVAQLGMCWVSLVFCGSVGISGGDV